MVTTNINLLPWREARRQKKEKQFLGAIVAGWIVAAIVAYGLVSHWNGKISDQNSRNMYLTTEIAKLTKTIQEIETLKQKRNAIVDRMEVIQELQADRTQIVHIFDSIVREMPEGVYLDALEKKGGRITMHGYAQANARVSTLMRNLEGSSWFQNPDLNIVKNKEDDGVDLSEFNLQVLEERNKDEGE